MRNKKSHKLNNKQPKMTEKMGKPDFSTSDMVKILEEEIVSLRRKIKSGRIRDVKNEEIRIKYLRTLGYLCKIVQELQGSLQMEAIKNEMDQLRQILAANGDRHD